MESGCKHKAESRGIAAKPQEILVLFKASFALEAKHPPHFITKHPRHEALAAFRGGT